MKAAIKITRNRVCFVFALLLIAHSSFATDLALKLVHWPANVVYENDEQEITFDVKNQNVLPADFFTSYITITKLGGGVVFSDVVESDTLKPDSTVTIKSNIKWKALTGRYRLDLYVDYQFDIDTTNNGYSTYFDVFISRDKAKMIFFNNLEDILKDTARSWAFMPMSPVDSGKVIKSRDSTEYSDTLKSPKWLVYLDVFKTPFYEHPGYVCTIDCYDSILAYDSINWFPVIDSIPYLDDFGDKLGTGDRLYGEDPTTDTIPNFKITYFDTTKTTSSDTVCAIIVSGKIDKNSSWERETFTNDLDLMEGNLTKEKLGPRISPAHIIRIGNASKQEILDAIKNMSDSCKKIIFYYIGHGGKYHMVTNDPVGYGLNYFELAQALDGTKAKDICVVIDACYSGSAESFFGLFSANSTKNYTLVTSSHSGKPSYLFNTFQLGDGSYFKASFFTWYFLKCFGDPAADVDGIPGTSFVEAYNCVRMLNPKLPTGESLDNGQNPQIMISRGTVPPPINVPYTPTDLGVTVTPRTELDSTAYLHITQHGNIDTLKTSDDSVVYISPNRYYTFDMGSYSGAYSFDLKYNYSFSLDYVDTTKGKVGAVARDSAGSEWKYAPPSIKFGQIRRKSAQTNMSAAEDTLEILGITKRIDFAVAIVVDQNKQGGSSNLNPICCGKVGVTLFPNPVVGNFIVEFPVDQAGMVTAEIFSMDGRLVDLQKSEFSAGMGRMTFDMSGRANGVYLIRLRGDQINYTGKMLKE